MDSIHITRWGGSGPRVVMVHGGAQGSRAAGERNFAAQKPLADEGWQLVVPDRPGHGKSPSPGRGDDADADAVWVADLLGDGAHLVGHSFGGLVALAAAARRPEAVLSLTLIEPALHKIATRDPAVRKFLLRLAAATLLSFSPVTRAKRVMQALHIPVSDFGRDDGELRAIGTALRRMKLPAKAAIERNLDAVKAARIPLLIVSGGSHQAFVAAGQAGAAMGGGQHVIAPSEHHFPQWSGDTFNRLLTEFWRGAEAKRAAR